MSTPVVAIIGRPNVGKSSLFNRLVGGSAAIVSDEAGTTRDRHYARAEWNGRVFWLVDTGGLPEDAIGVNAAIRDQIGHAITDADLVLFVTDALSGVTAADERVASILRQSGKPWLLVANKVDDAKTTEYFDMYRLGAGEPIPVSAQNGRQSGDLLDRITERLPDAPAEESAALRVAVVGRPNVGKSSFVNALLGEQRLVVSDVAGTTRDAIDTPIVYHGREYVFVDTAGLRRQSKISDGIEFYSSLRTQRAVERADVCVLLIDAVEGLHNQDLKIATLAWEAGCSLIVVVNKWDLVEKGDKTSAHLEREWCEKAPFLRWVPFIFASALTGQRVQRVLEVLREVEEERSKRVPTHQINETLQSLLARRQPPQSPGHEVRLNYATQVETAPPSIAVFGNHPELVAEHYVRYLHNGFREVYGFTGAPLRVLMRRKSGR